MAVREEVIELIREHGLERVHDPIERAIQGAIRVQCVLAPDVMEIGASRIGGFPDLPTGEPWPERNGRPLAFLAQFRMRDVAPYDAAKILPSGGTMYFFYDDEEQPWGINASDRGGWTVFHRDDASRAITRTEPPGTLPERSRFSLRAVRLSTEVTLPPYDSHIVQELDLDDDEQEGYTELLGALGADQTGRHRLLGYPDVIQNAMETDCEQESRPEYYSVFPEGMRAARLAELEQRAGDWRLLFQLDTVDDAGMMWGDDGRLYFWLREDSIKARRWDETWLRLQCY